MQASQSQRPEQDGVHKWLVLVSAYVTIVLNVGLCYALGSLFLPVMEEFQSTRAKSAAMQSTAFAVFAGTGIITGPIVKRFGARKAGFVGALFSTFGLSASCFASSVTHLVVGIGIFSGIGFSLIFLSAMAATERQFEGKRKLAVLSFLSTGAGIGGMCYPYFLVFLNGVYGVNGTLLIIGILCGHGIPSSLLWPNEGTHGEHDEKRSGDKDLNVSTVGRYAEAHSAERDICPFGDKTIKRDSAVRTRDLTLQGRSNVDEVSVNAHAELGRTISSLGRRSGNGLHVTNKRLTCVENENKNEDKQQGLTACESVLYLLKNRTFVLFLIGFATSMITFKVPFIFLADIFTDNGYEETDATLGLLLINAVGIFGRLCPGFVFQIPKFPTLGVAIIASFLAGLTLLLITLLPYLEVYLMGCVLIGLCQGVYASLLVMMPVRLFGGDNLPTASGLLMTGNSIGNALVGPVSGFIRDRTNSYNVPLYAAAGCAFTATCVFTLAHVLRRETNKKRKTTEPVCNVTQL